MLSVSLCRLRAFSWSDGFVSQSSFFIISVEPARSWLIIALNGEFRGYLSKLLHAEALRPPKKMAAMDLDSLNFTTFYNIINGERKTTSSTRHSLNPSNETPNLEVPLSTPADVEEAIEAARSAFRGWAALSWHDRRSAILKFADAFEQKTEEFAGLLNKEQGKPVDISNCFLLPLPSSSSNGSDCSFISPLTR